MDNEWMNNPAMKQIDPAKLELIRMAAERTAGRSGRDLVPVMLALINGADRTAKMAGSIFRKHAK